MRYQCNSAAKESGLECPQVNNDDFTILVSGGGRCSWVSKCTVWLSHSKRQRAEQQTCVKFCTKPEHSSVETIQMIQGFQGWHNECNTNKSGTNASKVVENLLKAMIHIPEGLQQAEHLKMLNVYSLQLTKISDWQCENQKLSWGFQKLLCPRFWCRILARNVLWQHSFHGFRCQSRWNVVLQLPITLGELCEVPRCLLWRGLRCYCPMDSVSCIFFNKCLFFLVHGWILTGQTSCPYL